MHIDQEEIYRLGSYNFELPSELIAQYPAQPRDHARLLVVDRTSGAIEDRCFYEIGDYLQNGDALVLNETRVIPARLLGFKESGARAEVFLLRKEGDLWEALVKPARRLKPGHRVYFHKDRPEYIEIIDDSPLEGGRLVAFRNCPDEAVLIEEMGRTPLPPYISRPDEAGDACDYQTVYANNSGSVAAPTAGLHFTGKLLEDIEAKGINLVKLLLHVGIGTFKPVSVPDIRQHQMHSEYYELSAQAAGLLNETRSRGGKICAVGTTVVRTLETIYDKKHGFRPGKGETNIFIYPGYRFQAVDRLVTNFHLPGSSLLMLVSAFAGWESTWKAYRHAVNERYRFFSYGDAMIIL
ncbi:MAG: tRNA preQ1(34) S-adenosylmethionine ribosyltransferase-isomerase QueA [Syntrophomonadaceae bacterium]